MNGQCRELNWCALLVDQLRSAVLLRSIDWCVDVKHQLIYQAINDIERLGLS